MTVNPCANTEKATTAKVIVTIASRRGKSSGSARARANTNAPRKCGHQLSVPEIIPWRQQVLSTRWSSIAAIITDMLPKRDLNRFHRRGA